MPPPHPLSRRHSLHMERTTGPRRSGTRNRILGPHHRPPGMPSIEAPPAWIMIDAQIARCLAWQTPRRRGCSAAPCVRGRSPSQDSSLGTLTSPDLGAEADGKDGTTPNDSSGAMALPVLTSNSSGHDRQNAPATTAVYRRGPHAGPSNPARQRAALAAKDRRTAYRGGLTAALLALVWGTVWTVDAWAQGSPYSAYRRLPYQRSPYASDDSYSYRVRNYNGLLSNNEYAREQLSVVAASSGLRPPSIYTPWYRGSYRMRYGIGYYGPYYPRYYYGYSDYYRPWYRWYRPWGGVLPWGWSGLLPAVPWGPGFVPERVPFPGEYGVGPELLAPNCPGPGPFGDIPNAPLIAPPDGSLEEHWPGNHVRDELPRELPGESLPQQPMPGEAVPQPPSRQAPPTDEERPSATGISTERSLVRPPKHTSAPALPVRNYNGAYYW